MTPDDKTPAVPIGEAGVCYLELKLGKKKLDALHNRKSGGKPSLMGDAYMQQRLPGEAERLQCVQRQLAYWPARGGSQHVDVAEAADAADAAAKRLGDGFLGGEAAGDELGASAARQVRRLLPFDRSKNPLLEASSGRSAQKSLDPVDIA